MTDTGFAIMDVKEDKKKESQQPLILSELIRELPEIVKRLRSEKQRVLGALEDISNPTLRSQLEGMLKGLDLEELFVSASSEDIQTEVEDLISQVEINSRHNHLKPTIRQAAIMPHLMRESNFQLFIDVSPQAALIWFLLSIDNRKVHSQTVTKCGNEMVKGTWVPARSTPISFDIHAHLINGQHRLLGVALVHQDMIPFSVIFGELPEVKEVIDTGKKRSSMDVATMRGLSPTPLQIATAKAIACASPSSKRINITGPENVDVYQAYAEGIHFSTENMSTSQRGVRRAPVLAAIARAYYNTGVDNRRLVQFMGILSDRPVDSQPGDEIIAAFTLKKYLLTHSEDHKLATPRNIYRRTCKMLYSFVHNQKPMKTTAANYECFSLPIHLKYPQLAELFNEEKC